MIHDEFSNLSMSRQRKYQLRKAKTGACTKCGEPAFFGSSMCKKHLLERRKIGFTKHREKVGIKLSSRKICDGRPRQETLHLTGKLPYAILNGILMTTIKNEYEQIAADRERLIGAYYE